MLESATEKKLDYELCEAAGRSLPVIIAAAGSSSRMGGINKQFSLLHGIPVLAHTLLAFERSQAISKIIVTTRSEDIPAVQLLCEKYRISKLSDITEGGGSRQESVAIALERLGSCEESVLIHDGARPLVDDKIILEVVSALERHCAVCCAVSLKDTVKKIDNNGIVTETIARESLVAVQTPQGVRVEEYRQAIKSADDLGRFTDDAAIMEAAGHKVYITPGSYENIKITTPEDILIAQMYLSRED